MRLLLAIDIHEDSMELLSLAIRWAEQLDGTLDLAYVDPHRTVLGQRSAPAPWEVMKEEWDSFHSTQRSRLDALLAAIPERRRGTAVYLEGRVHESLAEACERRDVLLIGTHGRSGVGHLLLGSIAERMVRCSPVPVIVLRGRPLPDLTG